MTEQPATETVEKPVEATVLQEQKPNEVQEEKFDEKRAMDTIKAQRAENKELKNQLKDYERLKADEAKRQQDSLSEIEREKQARMVAEQERDQLKRESLQRKAAENAGLPSAFADRIKGATIEEMTEDAKSLLESMPKKQAPTLPPGNPGGGDGTNTETDAQRRARLIG